MGGGGWGVWGMDGWGLLFGEKVLNAAVSSALKQSS